MQSCSVPAFEPDLLLPWRSNAPAPSFKHHWQLSLNRYPYVHPQLEQHEVAQGQNPIFSLPEGITTLTATASRQTPKNVHSFRLVSACVTRNREFRGDRGDLAARCENVSAGHGSVFVWLFVYVCVGVKKSFKRKKRQKVVYIFLPVVRTRTNIERSLWAGIICITKCKTSQA